MQAYYLDEKSVVYHSTALEALASLPNNSVDSFVTDPPYALTELDTAKITTALTHWVTNDRSYIPMIGKGFMGMEWDKFVPPPSLWDECFRVLKPGGYLLSFAGARTQDIMGISIRLAGFEIKDGIGWVTSQGFPKSMNVSKSIDKVLGAKREVIGKARSLSVMERGYDEFYESSAEDTGYGTNKSFSMGYEITKAESEEAAKWEGYGTALKPSFEPIIVARKPLSEANIAMNIMKHGVGALNIDATRVGTSEKDDQGQPLGRWTPNFVLSHTENCIETGENSDSFVRNRTEEWTGFGQQEKPKYNTESISFKTVVYRCTEFCPVRVLAEDSGINIGAEGEGVTSKFFPAFMYHKKAAKSEKPLLEDGKTHVSIKPLELMQWLVKLVTPSGGVVVDPFLGSGTTLEAARIEGLRVIGIEGQEAYMSLIKQRIDRS